MRGAALPLFADARRGLAGDGLEARFHRLSTLRITASAAFALLSAVAQSPAAAALLAASNSTEKFSKASRSSCSRATERGRQGRLRFWTGVMCRAPRQRR